MVGKEDSADRGVCSRPAADQHTVMESNQELHINVNQKYLYFPFNTAISCYVLLPLHCISEVNLLLFFSLHLFDI